jgi:hypothetical protein
MADDVSTRFPFVTLEKALVRAEALFQADKSAKPMLIPTAFELWGYSPKSSGAFQTVGALKGYGLIDDEGANADRRIRLTDRARRYFLDERDEIRAGMLASFALSPPLFRALWDNDGWSSGIPADTVARSHLKLERNLNDQSARSLLSIFKENIQFAGLKTGGAHEPSGESMGIQGGSMPPEEPKEGAQVSFSQPAHPAHHPAPPPGIAAQGRPIVFDMESVTISARIDNAEDLRDFIAKLQKLEPLMPTKSNQ